MPSQWDHKADKHLLLAIIENSDLKSISWPTIAGKMNAKGYTFTHEACRQHFQKIRKESRTSSGNNNDDSPSPGKRARTNGQNSTPRKSSKFQHGWLAKTNEDDDDDEEISTSFMRKRIVKKEEGKENGEGQSAYMFKMEDVGRDGVIDLERDDMYEA